MTKKHQNTISVAWIEYSLYKYSLSTCLNVCFCFAIIRNNYYLYNMLPKIKSQDLIQIKIRLK